MLINLVNLKLLDSPITCLYNHWLVNWLHNTNFKPDCMSLIWSQNKLLAICGVDVIWPYLSLFIIFSQGKLERRPWRPSSQKMRLWSGYQLGTGPCLANTTRRRSSPNCSMTISSTCCPWRNCGRHEENPPLWIGKTSRTVVIAID